MDDLTERIAKIQALTRRQREVFDLLCAGQSYTAIGERLVITEKAVHFHLRNIYIKFGIADLSRAQRQREIGLFCAAIAQPAPTALQDKSNDHAQVADPTEEEPTEEALVDIQALTAVLEDEQEYPLVLWKTAELQRIPSDPNPSDSSPRRRLRSCLPLVTHILIGMLLGAVLTVLLLDEAVSGSIGNLATSLPGVTNIALASSAPSPAPSVCSETTRMAASEADRFARSQGVSLFSEENTGGAVANNKIRTLAIDSRGLWIGYFATSRNQANGVGHYDKRSWAQCYAPEGMPENNINALAVDQIRRVWVATEKAGVAMFDGTMWHTYTMETDRGLPSNETFGLTVGKDNTIWLATLEGIAKFDGTAWSTVYTAEKKTIFYNNTHAIAFDNASNIWVGHISHGVSAFLKKEQRWVHFDTSNSLIGGNKIRSIVVQPSQAGSAETIWFATYDGGISTWQAGKWQVYRRADGLPSNTVFALALDKYNRVWAATDKGVAYFGGKGWIRYHDLPALSIAFGAPCTDCPFEDDEHVWTGTDGAGLTHSRLPYNEPAVRITEVCFEVAQRERACQQFEPEQQLAPTSVITATYPKTLHPGDPVQVEIFAEPNAPYKLNPGDMLVNTAGQNDFGTHTHIAVSRTIESGEPFKFADYNRPFLAPSLAEGEQERTFISTWRMWMHTRYAGPTLQLQFQVHR